MHCDEVIEKNIFLLKFIYLYIPALFTQYVRLDKRGFSLNQIYSNSYTLKISFVSARKM